MFDRIVVISLAHRQDRLEAFCECFTRAWPGMECEAFHAVDGRLQTVPALWKGTPGAWGCLQSHATVIEQSLSDGTESVLIFEDDATFVPDFAKRLADLSIPPDAEQLYLGGQHLKPPKPGPPGFVRGRNVNRTHAYAILGRAALEKLRDHLRWDPASWGPRFHVDHHFGKLHERGGIVAYAVNPWLCGQAAGVSDIDGKTWPTRAWA